MRRTLAVLSVVMASLAAGCGGGSDDPAPAPQCSGFGSGTVPTLAANQLVFDSDRAGGRHEIYSMRTDGTCVHRLTTDPAYENWWPRISPDRAKVLFYRAPAGSPENYNLASLWVINADGTGLLRLRTAGENGWSMQGHAEWSPDGSKIAMFGTVGTAGTPGSSVEIFVTDAGGKNPVQYTNRGGVNTDVSWSPNGQQLLFNGCPSAATCEPANYEIYRMNATALATPERLTNDNVADYDPYFSPDGTRIAWLTNVNPNANEIPGTGVFLGQWSIKLRPSNLSQPATYLINDGHINSKPAWSGDGQTIWFHRMVVAESLRFRIFSIRADGTGLAELSPGAASGNSEYPSN